MKYTKEEVKAMYEYDRMMYGDFVDFAAFKKILKKALKNEKYFSFSKIFANIIL